MIQDLTEALFWDVNKALLSEEDHAAFIINRVCMLGLWSDWVLLKKYYGIEKIREELLKARYLDPKTLNYFSLIFNVPKENFRCFTSPLSAPAHWNY